MEADELKQSYASLVTLLERGELKLKDEQGIQMNVPKQCVKTCDQAEFLDDPEDLTLLIIGSVALSIVLIVLICIICGVFVKKRNQDEKLKRLISPDLNNRYFFFTNYLQF